MATILEGLNAISQAVGGTAEAENNLEALNAISAALGGSADAENNADAIANIAENASGGGGAKIYLAPQNFLTNNPTITYVNGSGEVVTGKLYPAPGNPGVEASALAVNGVIDHQVIARASDAYAGSYSATSGSVKRVLVDGTYLFIAINMQAGAVVTFGTSES